MSKYDVNLDVLIQEVGRADTETGQIVSRIFSYNGGPHKVGLNRAYINKSGDERFASLGRVQEAEVAALIGLLESSLDALSK